jgi:hypothetical protein
LPPVPKSAAAKSSNPDFGFPPGVSPGLPRAWQIAALWRFWRGFRIAGCSRERDDATLPKIWTPCVVAVSRTTTLEASMNHHAVVSGFSRAAPPWK